MKETTKETIKENIKKCLKHYRIGVLIFGILLIANGIYQYTKNPINILSNLPVSSVKSPTQTWQAYGPIFKQYSNSWLTPTQLAALAQAESAGNIFAAPKWTFHMTSDLTDVYGPHSTAFGLLQITQPTFDMISDKCSSDCPYFWLITRASAKDSIRLTALYHQIALSNLISHRKFSKLSRVRKTQLISAVHLCGPEVGAKLIKKHFSMNHLGNCHSENLKRYARTVIKNEKLFARMSRRK